MSVMPPVSRPSRKDEALAFITDYLIAHGHSPTIPEIADALSVSVTRAKALVHRLAADKAIERLPGAQRAISVPGLLHRRAIDQLLADGWVVNVDTRRLDPPRAFPKGHLPLVAVLEHSPGPERGGSDGDDSLEHGA